MQEIIVTGKTVEEAINKACKALSRSRDEVSVEVLEIEQKKLFRTIPAKVRVFVSEESLSIKELIGQIGLKSEEQIDDEKSENVKEVKKSVDNTQVPPKAEPKKIETVRQEKIIEKAKAVAATEDKIKGSTSEATEKELETEVLKTVDESELPISAKTAYEYLRTIVDKMGAKSVVFGIEEIPRGFKFIIAGEDASLLIGRRGETMDALQYLSLLAGNRSGGDYCKISVDIANYREDREKALDALAKRVAKRVLKNNRSQTLEPMNPYERRIIHSVIQEIPGVHSESIGQDPRRRVVILKEGEHPRQKQGSGRSDKKRGRKPADKRQIQKINTPTQIKEEVKQLETGKNLYSKIDI
ncbi:MAG: KH domain-containing protein [Ruminococcaceae bacterium]|nr:KH domain-containing protein [Oscillospiraceae bacterium]